jgi:precorrin-3B C17-methyltransferase
MTFAAANALAESDVICGYDVYVDLIRRDYPDKELVSTGMRREADRARFALESAREGKTVSVVCSGDPNVYGMGSLVLEMAEDGSPVEIVAIGGVTAALSGGALLGSPISGDFATVSLSDLMTPWETIELRLDCAAKGDFPICIYNPASRARRDHLLRACDIILAHRTPDTVCGYVRMIGREGQEVVYLSLGELRETTLDMFTTAFVGNSQTRMIDGKMVTPRGYKVHV